MTGASREESELLLDAYRIRTLEQRVLALFAAGKIDGTVHTCIGQELTGLAVCEQLQGDDIVLSNHRCHGHYAARFGEVRSLLAELLGAPSGVCSGFGGSQHLHRPGFYSSGIQGGQTPAAVGMALAQRMRSLGTIVVVFIGDGTLGEGIVYESFNLAAKLALPVLFVLEDNLYAQSTSQTETLAGTIEGRAVGFGLGYVRTSTFEVTPLRARCREAVERVRQQCMPVLLHIDTYRLGAHSKGDDLRDLREIERYEARDPLTRMVVRADSDPLLRAQLAGIAGEIDRLVEELLAEPRDLRVTAGDWWHARGSVAMEPFPGVLPAETQVKAINRALHEHMAAHREWIVLGEDVRDPYGGTFKVTRGLSDRFSDRVLNMPISEAAIVGVGLGLALAGHPAIVEIMFGDFVTLAFDQLVNHVGKTHEMYGRSLAVPLVIRTPMGGRRGYGATHSQSLEKHLLGIPGTDLFVLHPRVDAHRFYVELCGQVRRAAIVVENKQLYAVAPGRDLPAGYSVRASDERFPLTLLTTARQADVTVVCFGGIGLEVESAADALSEDDICLDIWYPLHINGSSVQPIAESVRRTGRLLFVEEGTDAGTLSTEYFRRILEAAQLEQMPAFKFVAAESRPIPAASYLERQVLPGLREIYDAVLDLHG